LGIGTLYIDGESVAASQLGPGPPDGASSSLELGSDVNLSSILDGTLDEFRVSDVLRSPAWIRASYDNQADPAAFVESQAAVLTPCP
jgi:hypothetical protein